MEDLNLDIFNLLDNQPSPSRGFVLVAKPTVEDWVFKRSVSILVDHDNEEGTMGIIVNKPTRFYLDELLPEIEIAHELPLYLGGPVGTNQLFFIHTLGNDVIPDSLQLTSELFFGGDFEVVKMYLASGQPVEGKMKFLIGYSGWTSGQLDGELERHDWAVLKSPSEELLMSTPDELMWNQAVSQFGDQYRLWKNWPDDVSMN